MTDMTIPPSSSAPPPERRIYGFNVYKDGDLIREQIVFAATSAIAEVKIWRLLSPGEYVWYAEPRLIELNDATIGALIDHETKSVGDEEDA